MDEMRRQSVVWRNKHKGLYHASNMYSIACAHGRLGFGRVQERDELFVGS